MMKIWQILTRELKVSKIYTLMGCFWKDYIVLELKNYRGVMFICTQDFYKVWRKTGLRFQKLTWGVWQIFAWKSPNWDLCLQNAILLSKVENVWALQGSYVSSQWRVMQKLKRNWLVSSKLTWGIWQILTWALKNLKNLHFNGLLLNKVYNFWAKRSIGEFCLMALKTDATSEGKLTCAFKIDMRNLANFHQSMFGSLKIGTLMGSFYSK